MDVLRSKFGGASEGGESFKGKIEQLKNAWDELKETIGTPLMDLSKYPISWLTDMINNTQEWGEVITHALTPWEAQLGAIRRANAEIIRQHKEMKDEEAKAKRATEYKEMAKQAQAQYESDREWSMKRLELSGDVFGQLNLQRDIDLDKARKAKLDEYGIWLFYEDKKTTLVNEQITKRIADEKRFLDAEKAMMEEAAAIVKEWGLEEIYGPELEVKKTKEKFEKLLNAMMGVSTPEQIEELKRVYAQKLGEIQEGAVEKWAAKIPEGVNQGQENWMVEFMAKPALNALDVAIKGALDEMEQFRVGIQKKPAIMEIKVLDDEVTQAILDANALQKSLIEMSQKQWIVNVETNYTSTGDKPLTVAPPATPEYHAEWLEDQKRIARNAEVLWRPYFDAQSVMISETGNEYVKLYKQIEDAKSKMEVFFNDEQKEFAAPLAIKIVDDNAIIQAQAELSKIGKILDDNWNKPFVQRILHPELFPTLDLGGGEFATHKMAWGTVGDTPIVFPTVAMVDGKLIDLSEEGIDPVKRALEKNDYITFKTEMDADWFSKNYKKWWGDIEEKFADNPLIISTKNDDMTRAIKEAQTLNNQLIEMTKNQWIVNVEILYNSTGSPPIGVASPTPVENKWYGVPPEANPYIPPEIPEYGEGGVIDRPTVAVVGEKGKREYIIPEDKMGQGVSISLHVGTINAGGNGAVDIQKILRDLDEGFRDMWHKDRSSLKTEIKKDLPWLK
jgi:hypothetical protein